MRRALAAAALPLGVAGCQQAVTGPPRVLTAEPAEGQCTLQIAIQGMDCETGCAVDVHRALENEGAIQAAVDYPRSRAAVLTDAEGCSEQARGRWLTPNEAKGFDARILKVKHGG